MPAILIKTNNPKEYVVVEIQGDLEYRSDREKCEGKFIGDLLFNKYGNPILIIGHHILHGKEKTLEKPLAVIQKMPKKDVNAEDGEEERPFDATIIQPSQIDMSLSILDSTVLIENRTKVQCEYEVIAIIKKKLVFNQRPRPIISNVPKCI